jgi:hypothetical protein
LLSFFEITPYLHQIFFAIEGLDSKHSFHYFDNLVWLIKIFQSVLILNQLIELNF